MCNVLQQFQGYLGVSGVDSGFSWMPEELLKCKYNGKSSVRDQREASVSWCCSGIVVIDLTHRRRALTP